MPAISPDTLYKTLIKGYLLHCRRYHSSVVLYKTSAVVLLLLFAMILALGHQCTGSAAGEERHPQVLGSPYRLWDHSRCVCFYSAGS
jgi:hypothetical protein